MAKITANGAREVARWRKSPSGAELVLTTDGRLLMKQRMGTWKLYKRGQTTSTAGAQAAILGYTLVR